MTLPFSTSSQRKWTNEIRIARLYFTPVRRCLCKMKFTDYRINNSESSSTWFQHFTYSRAFDGWNKRYLNELLGTQNACQTGRKGWKRRNGERSEYKQDEEKVCKWWSKWRWHTKTHFIVFFSFFFPRRPINGRVQSASSHSSRRNHLSHRFVIHLNVERST